MNNVTMPARKKDTWIGTSGYKTKQASTMGDDGQPKTIHTLYLTPESAAVLIDELTKVAATPNGVRIQLLTCKKMAKAGRTAGHLFDSASLVVAAKEDSPFQANARAADATSTHSRIEEIRKAQVKG